MKNSTILKKVLEESSIEEVVNYFDDCLKKGMTSGLISRASPVKMTPRVVEQVLDLWYPGYNELSTTERRLWLLEQWPQYHIHNGHWSKLYDPDHPIFKYFTRTNGLAFHGQKCAAAKRGIEWKFDYFTWILWWVQTGHFDERGVWNHTYQMCRKGDTGPYSWDNVYCDTGLNNKNARKKKTDK